jgi:hypothetical protein
VIDVVQETPTLHVIRNAVTLACRAPSLHNSQPWRWVADGQTLHLFADGSRLMLAADSAGREMTLSCGGALDHVQVALAAAGWKTAIERFPDRHDPQHLAVIRLSPMETITDDHRERADAIFRRRTDRLPFAAPTDWTSLQSVLRQAVLKHHVMFDVVLDDARVQLAEASRLTETLRQYDPSYQTELRWWTSPFELDEGVPQGALVSASEAARVDVSRRFPPAGRGNRRPQVGFDQSKIVVLSSIHEDERLEVLRCGEALSTVLLECTIAGMATCTLTHMIEVEPSRDIVRKLIGQAGLPQVLVRVGTAPATGEQPAPTPRRAITEVLEFRS